MGSKKVKNDSPSVAKKKNIALRKRKLKSKSKSKSKSNDAPTPPFTRNPTGRNLLSNLGNNRKKNPQEAAKKENEAGPSTQAGSDISQPSTNEIDVGGIISTEKDADKYFMRHKKRGLAIILNHENFDREKKRNGTEKDVEKLKEVLGKLKFKVKVYTDLKYRQISKLLKKLSAADYRDSDCIMFFILTHGNEEGYVAAKDVLYPVEQLWKKFTSDKCSSLAGKPKLFFVNACRGKEKDFGLRLFPGRTEADTSQKMQSYKIPNHADFLIAYSTVQGFTSYRNATKGTWFIQSLCEVLNEHYETKDLLSMLTMTTRKVALDFKTEEKNCEHYQVPAITSMLLRDVYFNL